MFVVVAYHAAVPGFSGGFAGVDVFFVLSGYLITWLLVHEGERDGRIDLLRFYARRFRRLLPAMAVVTLVTAIATAIVYAPYEQLELFHTWIATALYSSNVLFAYEGSNYHGLGAAMNPLLHTWSLAVEEQFYFVWPLLCTAAMGLIWKRTAATASRRRIILWLGVAGTVSFAYSLYATANQPHWAFYFSAARAWEFAAGGVAVLVLSTAREGSGMSQALAWLGIAVLLAVTALLDESVAWPGWAATVPVAATILVLQAGTREGSESSTLGRVLGTSLMQWGGRLSYSWYLWHWPVLVLVGAYAGGLGLGGRIAAGLLSLVPAWLSYTYVETPLRYNKVLVTPPLRAFAWAGAVSVVVLALTVAWSAGATTWESSGSQAGLTRQIRSVPQVYVDRCDAYRRTTTPIDCAYGDSMATRTVVLAGDSHAAQWAPVLDEAAQKEGWKLMTYIMSACPLVDTPVYVNRLGRIHTECTEWRGRVLNALDEIQPDLVVVASASNTTASADDWEAGTSRVLERLSTSSRRTALVLDNPGAGFDVGACAARADWGPANSDCVLDGRPGEASLVSAQIRAADEHGIETIDLRDRIAVVGETKMFDGGMLRYRDDDHLTVDFAMTFEPQFRALLRPPQTARRLP